MPCWSSVKTQITDAGRLGESLRALGFQSVEVSELRVSAGGAALFQRQRSGVPFSTVQYTSNLDEAALAPIAKKYAELGVRQWAKTHGFAVRSVKGDQIELVKRG